MLQPVAPVQEAAPPDASAPPRAKPKPKRNPNLPPASITVINASTAVATDVTVGTEEKMARLPKPLQPKARAVLKLPRLKGCIVSVRANLEGIGEIDTAEFNVCKEKSIRLVGT